MGKRVQERRGERGGKKIRVRVSIGEGDNGRLRRG